MLEVVVSSQRITVPAMLTINDAACSWRVTRNNLASIHRTNSCALGGYAPTGPAPRAGPGGVRKGVWGKLRGTVGLGAGYPGGFLQNGPQARCLPCAIGRFLLCLVSCGDR